MNEGEAGPHGAFDRILVESMGMGARHQCLGLAQNCMQASYIYKIFRYPCSGVLLEILPEEAKEPACCDATVQRV